MQTNISVSMWNINGLSNKVLGDKTKNNDFLKDISRCDFIYLTETWANETISIPGFKATSSYTSPPNQTEEVDSLVALLYCLT